jgi:DNA-binding transcriptional LysR family regulator
MARYSQQMPDVHVSINVTPSSELIARSIKMKNDIAFFSYEVKDKNLMVQPVVTEKLVIITKPDHRFSKMKYISPEDLDGETMISHEEGSIQKQVIDGMIEDYDLDIKILGVDYTSNEAIKASVDLGEGIALISERAVARAVKTGLLYAVPIGKKPLTRKLYMGWHRDRIITPKIRAIIDLCQEIF